MDLLVEKGNNKTYLSQLGFLVTSFEEEAPTIARNSTNIQGRSGSVDFGGWHESKNVKLEGFYRAEDQYEEEMLKERLFALLSDPEGIYITEMRGEIGQGFERPGETEGEVYEHMMTRPSHKRFYVYASSIENELQGNVGGTVLYKMSVEFTTLKLPYGESVPRDLDVKPITVNNAVGTNLLTNTGADYNPSFWSDSSETTYLVNDGIVTVSSKGKSVFTSTQQGMPLAAGDHVVLSIDVKGTGNVSSGYNNGDNFEDDSPIQSVNSPDTWKRIYFYRTLINFNAQKAQRITFDTFKGSDVQLRRPKLEKGYYATDWSLNPADSGYNEWYLDTYYNTDNLVVPYSGTVPCNQLEQGFSIELTAKEGGSGLKIDINGTELTYNGQVYNGDVLKLSGYEYTKNGLSVVRSTNKAYFKLLPNVTNTLSASLHGTIKVLNFQNLYA